MPLSSRLDAIISRLSSLFHSQPHTTEEIELTQRQSSPRVVEVAAVRDRQTLVVARGAQFEKAKRAYEQQTQAQASHTQPADASTSAIPPAPGTTTAGAAVAVSTHPMCTINFVSLLHDSCNASNTIMLIVVN
ncbi:hypothetical protein F4604DRAFT_1682515 [Suillus subluteus]|nr:hypothetical protein F4604DRAFT_1682515 [Suillus subluteus]